jgi:hypothetical protein
MPFSGPSTHTALAAQQSRGTGAKGQGRCRHIRKGPSGIALVVYACMEPTR